MCGLTGFWAADGPVGDHAMIASGMADRIRHRGPDDSGVWTDDEAGIALAHRRLAIVDLSSAGHQPMVSASGRWVIVYNGEIYNHLELRSRLEIEGATPGWRGHSDTETLLACVEAWGIDGALKRSVGMFALAIWDRRERTLTLARDRIGEKPLYYGWQGGVFLFGSELKALKAHPAFGAAVDRGAMALLLRRNYIPAPYSIYEGIYKLLPGTWLQIDRGKRDHEPVVYWSLSGVAERGTTHPFEGSNSDALDTLECHLGNAVRRQMMSDVPLGALLSGGIDSTLVTALMQASSSRPVRTFTVGFDEEQCDETMHARSIAMHLGTDHTEVQLGGREALDLIPQLPSIYDEPFADSSQLPTHLVMKVARRHVAVTLSGDGGDEMFGGYNRYLLAPKLWQLLEPLPPPARTMLVRAIGLLPDSVVARMTGTVQATDKLRKLARVFEEGNIRSIDSLYVGLVSEWMRPALANGERVLPPNLLNEREKWPKLQSPVSRMMVLDALTYLPDDILTKVDRASMAVSLETRAPFLDREVVEFAWTLPASMKFRRGKGKSILRQMLKRHVPSALVERPKMGFGIPLDQWLRGPLRDWAETLLDEARLHREGFLDPAPIRRAWKRHVDGEASNGYRLWSVLMFQAWLEQSEAVH